MESETKNRVESGTANIMETDTCSFVNFMFHRKVAENLEKYSHEYSVHCRTTPAMIEILFLVYHCRHQRTSPC